MSILTQVAAIGFDILSHTIADFTKSSRWTQTFSSKTFQERRNPLCLFVQLKNINCDFLDVILAKLNLSKRRVGKFGVKFH